MASLPVPTPQTILRTLRSGLRAVRTNLCQQSPRVGPLAHTPWQRIIIEYVTHIYLTLQYIMYVW
jgi:hypothetical protein